MALPTSLLDFSSHLIHTRGIGSSIHRDEYKTESDATSDFENEFFRLAKNAVFGKPMESLRKRLRVVWFVLVQSSREDKLRKLIADPTYLP